MNNFGVDPGLNSAIKQAQLQMREVYRDSLRAGVSLGHLLIKAKASCYHGQWKNWLKNNYEGSERHGQRLMALAEKFPTPADVPAMSLREAMKMIAGKQSKEKTFFSHERLSPDTLEMCIAGLQIMDDILGEKVLDALEVEGVTKQHTAMKSTKKIRAEIVKMRDYLDSQLVAPEQEIATAGK